MTVCPGNNHFRGIFFMQQEEPGRECWIEQCKERVMEIYRGHILAV